MSNGKNLFVFWSIVSLWLSPMVVMGDETAFLAFEQPEHSGNGPAVPAGFVVDDSPYTISLFNHQNGEDYQRLVSQSKILAASGLGIIGALSIMPESITNWDLDSVDFRDGINNWLNNWIERPQWDNDDWYLNWFGHTYCGGVYYQIARHSGYRQWDSFVYSALMSTFYWEYGIEAFAEQASIQDLIITPVLGWTYGEWAFRTEMSIHNDNGKVLGSRLLGSLSLFLLNPLEGIAAGVNSITGKKWFKTGSSYISYTPVHADDKFYHAVMLHINAPFAEESSARVSGRQNRACNDPVTVNIVGVSLGCGLFFGQHLDMDDELAYKWSVGLYPDKQFAFRLSYLWSSRKDFVPADKQDVERYSVDGLLYLFDNKKFCPYFVAGVGEIWFESESDHKSFQWNLGVGLNWQLDNNWALQSELTYYFTPVEQDLSQSVLFLLSYRFGN